MPWKDRREPRRARDSGAWTYHLAVHEILAALGPALELFGWIALLGAVGFFVMARVSRSVHATWREAPCAVTELEGQQCLVWSSGDGTAHSRALDELDHASAGDPSRVYYKVSAPHRIQLEPPRSHVRFLLALAWSMLVLWALCNIVPLAVQQMLISAPA